MLDSILLLRREDFDMSDSGSSYALGRAWAAELNASEWEAYARNLELELKIAKAENWGFAAVRDATLREISKLDPNNYLLIQENRKAIFDQAKNAQLKSQPKN
jgi:hypothetical protein